MYSLCGCWYVHLYQRHYLPLLESEVHSTILSTTSRTVLTQTFTNPSSTDRISECVYEFPLYDGVSVVSFTCRIGDRVLRGLVKERAKAKQIFEAAVAQGETAGLLQQSTQASDVFSTKLGNIPAGEKVIVEITYNGELKHHETDGIRFTIPTRIAPRYGSDQGFDMSRAWATEENGGIKVTVDINMPEGSFIKGVQSPSHPIAVSMGTISTASDADPIMSKASATLSLGSAALEKDFVLVVQSKEVGIPKAILETHPTIPNHRALMATLVPKFSLPPSRPEIIFVADRSGSMQQNIPMLISAMQVFLKSIPPGVKFNICSFGGYYNFLWEKSQTYNKKSLEEATRHIKSFGANMGGTETFAAIKATIDRRYTDLPLEVILLTDGDIWNQENLFTYVNQQVEESKGNIRVFTLGIGSGVSHALIEGLARAGNGFSQAVQDGERLDNCVVRMLRGALSPHITDYTLEVKYEEENDGFELIDKVDDGVKCLLTEDKSLLSEELKPAKPTISLFDPSVNPEKEDVKHSTSQHLPYISPPKLLQAPYRIPSLFAFSRTTVYLLMSPETIQRKPIAVILRATSPHGPLELSIPIESLASPAETIHQLAAKKAVQDFEEGRGWIYDAKDQNGTLIKDRYPSCFDELIQREAVRLGEKFQVASKWCSFVAVAANDKEIASNVEGTNTDREDDGDFELAAALQPMSMSSTGSLPLESHRFSPRRRFAAQSQPGGSTWASPPAAVPILSMFGGAPTPPPPSAPKQPFFGAAPSNLFGGIMRRTSKELASPMSSPSAFGRPSAMPPPPPAPAAAISRAGNAAPLFDMMVPAEDSSQESGLQRGKKKKSAAPGSFGRGAGARPAVGFAKSERKTRDDRSGSISPENLGGKKGRADWASKAISERVLALISLQEFEGLWRHDDQEIARILGFAIPPSADAGKKDAWVTLVVVKFLEEKCGEEEGTWGLVVEKARAWLDGCGITGLEDLEKEATALIRK